MSWTSRNNAIALGAVMAGIAMGTTPSSASEGRIPLHQPTVITTPGSYVVTRDIASASGPILEIRTGRVRVDLNGHTLSVSSTADPVVSIASVMGIDPQPIHILNGTIAGGRYGIRAGAGINPRCRFADLTLGGQAEASISIAALGDLEAKGIIVVDTKTAFDLTGTAGMSRASISGSTIRGEGGIHCNGVTCSVRDSRITISEVGGAAATPALRLQGSTGGEAVGIVVVDTRPSSTGSVIDLLAARGIVVVDTKILGPMDGTGGTGIAVDASSADVTLAGIEVSGMGMDAISILAATGIVRDSLLSHNGGNGLFVGGSGILVDGVKADTNEGAGLWFETSGHVYRNTVLIGNNGRSVDGPGALGAVDGGGNVQ